MKLMGSPPNLRRDLQMEENNNWKAKTIIMGTVIGAVAGAISALMLIQRAEKENTTPKLSTGEGIQVGLGLLGLLRMISGLGLD